MKGCLFGVTGLSSLFVENWFTSNDHCDKAKYRKDPWCNDSCDRQSREHNESQNHAKNKPDDASWGLQIHTDLERNSCFKVS